MSELVIACIRTGHLLPFDCVKVLRNALARHLPRKYTMVCMTDQPERCSDVAFVDISAMSLPRGWAKMALFEPQWREGAKVIHFDFGTAVIGDISPLADVPGEFSIGDGFDTSVMVIGGGMGNFVWHAFERRRDILLMDHRRAGVSGCLKELYPSAPFLQQLLPPDFFNRSLRLM